MSGKLRKFPKPLKYVLRTGFCQTLKSSASYRDFQMRKSCLRTTFLPTWPYFYGASTCDGLPHSQSCQEPEPVPGRSVPTADPEEAGGDCGRDESLTPSGRAQAAGGQTSNLSRFGGRAAHSPRAPTRSVNLQQLQLLGSYRSVDWNE